MKAVVVYESMYGNTHHVATEIGEGLKAAADVTVVAVEAADDARLASVDLIVVGGPTHVHGMSHAGTRKAAVTAAQKPGSDLELDPDAEGPGLRDWFDAIESFPGRAVAFDTRMDGPTVLTGRGSKGIARKLRHHGAQLITDPESFLVTKDNQLEPHEAERAREWGATLGRLAATAADANAET